MVCVRPERPVLYRCTIGTVLLFEEAGHPPAVKRMVVDWQVRSDLDGQERRLDPPCCRAEEGSPGCWRVVIDGLLLDARCCRRYLVETLEMRMVPPF